MTAEHAFWDGIAEGYAAQPLPNPDATARKLALTRALMRPEHRVLDFGCGTGTIALRLCDAVAHIHGLDISPAMIRIARDKAIKQGADNVHFQAGPFDEESVPFEDGSLDGILAYNIVHLVPDPEACLRQVHRLLKPGGYFVQSTAFLGGAWTPYWLLIPIMRLLGKAPNHVGMLKKPQLLDDMARLGFVDVVEHDVGSETTSAFIVARKA